jgi:hypothetical protein
MGSLIEASAPASGRTSPVSSECRGSAGDSLAESKGTAAFEVLAATFWVVLRPLSEEYQVPPGEDVRIG